MSRTLFAKIWDRHTVMTRPDGATLLHVARHLVHDGSRAGFVRLREQGLTVGRFDSRYSGRDYDDVGELPDADPSSYAVDSAFERHSTN